MGQVDFNKLWQNFLDTVTNHYFDLNGRIGRPQFWYFILVCVVVSIGAAIIDAIIGARLLSSLVSLALLLPMGGMAMRRIHDTAQFNQYGWVVWVWIAIAAIYNIFAFLLALTGVLGAVFFLLFFLSIGSLLLLVELVAAIAIVFFCAQPGEAGANAFGPPPPVWAPGPVAPSTPAV